MKHPGYPPRVFAMMAAVLLAVSCANPGTAVMQTAPPSAPPIATPTPEPLNGALGAGNYHVLYNGAAGVVDSRGKVVVPFNYSEIDMLSTTSGQNGAGGKVLFFATQYAGLKKGTAEENDIPGYEDQNSYNSVLNGMRGYLLTAAGKRVLNYALKWATQLSDTLIAVAKEGTSHAGVIDFSGKTVIPFEYLNIYPAKNTIAAVKRSGGTYRMDFYDMAGKKKGSLRIGGADVICTGYSWVVKGTNKKYGFVGENMKWICAPTYEDIYGYDDTDSGTQDLFEGDIGDGYKILNQYGQKFDIPNDADITECSDDYGDIQQWEGHLLYFVIGSDSESTRMELIDDTGKVLFESDAVSHPWDASFSGGILIVDGRAFDMSGKDMLPGVNNVRQWVEADRLFICDTAVYTAAGQKLPLPEAASITYFTKDRYAVQTIDFGYGIYDSKGMLIATPSWDFPASDIQWPLFGIAVYGDTKYGLMDSSGRIIYDAIFDDITPTADGLYEVQYGNYNGLIDAEGHWIWYATVYNALTD